MAVIALVLKIAAFVLFVLGAIGVAAGRFSLIAAGLACWVLADTLTGNLSAAG